MSAVDSSLHEAVQHLYRDHHGWLYGWLRRRLGCADNAADLAQDTFARLLASRRVLEAREPRAYLDALAALPEELAPPPERRLLVLETLHEIDAMLDGLPEGVRRAFLLSQLEGMKYEAIAAELGVSLGSIKRYMQQAFRQCLELMA